MKNNRDVRESAGSKRPLRDRHLLQIAVVAGIVGALGGLAFVLVMKLYSPFPEPLLTLQTSMIAIQAAISSVIVWLWMAYLLCYRSRLKWILAAALAPFVQLLEPIP